MFNKHKMEFQSQPCTFFGYSTQHKGYLCLTPEDKIVVSRYVVFDEKRFLFSEVTLPSKVDTIVTSVLVVRFKCRRLLLLIGLVVLVVLRQFEYLLLIMLLITVVIHLILVQCLFWSVLME